MGTTKSAYATKVALLIAGMTKNFAANITLNVLGQAMTQAQIIAQLTGIATLMTNNTDAKAAWAAAVAAEKAGMPAGKAFVEGLIATVKQALGPSSPLMSSFGIATPKPKAVRTAAEKLVTTALTKNTKKVRGTMSDKARQSITTTGKPGITVTGPDGTPILTVSPVAPGSAEPPTETVGAAPAPASTGSTPPAGTGSGSNGSNP